MAMRAMPSLRLKVFMPATLHSCFHTEVDAFHIFTVFNDCKYTKFNNNGTCWVRFTIDSAKPFSLNTMFCMLASTAQMDVIYARLELFP